MIDSLLQMNVLYHLDRPFREGRPYLWPRNLNALEPFRRWDVGRDAMDNRLAEGRAFLADGMDARADYVGFASARWQEKYPWAPPLARLDGLERWLAPDVVLAPDWTAQDWVMESERGHPGMWRRLEEMFKEFGRPGRRPTLYGNSFVCSYKVYDDLAWFFRRVFRHFHRKYGFDLGYAIGPHDPARLPAYFYERATMLYFSQRNDLVVRKFPSREEILAGPRTPPEALMAETSKAYKRRVREGWFDKHVDLSRPGIDIGCGKDPLNAVFRRYDKEHGDGDATFMSDVPDGAFWTVYASHVLEHLHDPGVALENWARIAAVGGRIIVSVPHRDMYEKKLSLPSRWNGDHKTFWLPTHHEAPHTRGLRQTVEEALGDTVEILDLRVVDEGFHDPGPEVHSHGEFSIEAVLRKVR